MALIELRQIKKTYEVGDMLVPVLHGITLDIQTGEFVSIMGPSGSGKSTLMHIMGLLDRPSSGTYFFDGHDMSHLSEEALAQFRNRSVGFVFQAFHLLGRTTVLENVMLPLQYSSLPSAERRVRAERVLEQVGLSHRLSHLPTQISGGEKQRVAIARALVVEPKVIFADEPTGNLDSRNGEAVLRLIKELNTQGRTIILVTHELEAAQVAQRIITIRDGLMATDEHVNVSTSGSLLQDKGTYDHS